MKKDRDLLLCIERLLKVILSVVFLPVLFCIVVFGMNIDYYEKFKLETVAPNQLLFLIAVPVLIFTIYLIYMGNKYPLKQKSNRILNVILCLLFIGVYFVMERIAREIVYHLPWDICTVCGTAMENVAKNIPVGYSSYYAMYKNNIPIAYILGKLYKWSTESVSYTRNPSFIWVQVNCVLLSLGGFFSCLTVKRLTKNLIVTILVFFLNFLLVCTSGWMIAPYTDTYGLLFPILCIYLYICYKQADCGWKKVLYLASSILTGVIGGFIKPNLYLVLIAIFLTELLGLITNIKQHWRYILFSVGWLLLLLFASSICRNKIVEVMGIELNENVEAGLLDYFHMGLNEETTGAYYSNDIAIFGEFQYEGKEARNAALLERSWERMRERGFFGQLYFWLAKMVMTFNDGMFSWSMEAWPFSHYEPVVSTNTPFMEFLRQVYWNGPYKGAHHTIGQLIWIYCMCGIPGLCLAKRKQQGNVILLLCFLGVFFYQLIFEARARYLFAFLPLIIVIATYGMYQYSLIISQYLRRESQEIVRKLSEDTI